MPRNQILIVLLVAASALSVPAEAAKPTSSVSAYATWGYPFTGFAIGDAGLEVVAQPFGPPRIYATADSEWPGGPESRYWFAIRKNGADFTSTFVSPYYRAGLRRLDVGDLAGDGAREVVLGLGDGTIVVYDEAALQPQSSFATAAANLRGLVVADCGGAAGDEIVVSTTSNLWVYAPDGVLLWTVPGVGSSELLAGQVDGDPALEIVTSGGAVIDCAERAVQWTRPGGQASVSALGDVDLDGRDELVVGLATSWQPVQAFDVDTGSQKWAVGRLPGFEAIHVALTLSGPIVFAADQLNLHAYDPLSLVELWTVPNPRHGVTNLWFGDADGDSLPELVWGGGNRTTAYDRLYLLDPSTRQIEWQSVQLDGPAVGPAVGDVDGDGVDDLVLASHESDSGYEAGVVVVVPGGGGEPILAAAAGPYLGIWDIAVGDLEGDGRAEILVAGERVYDALVDVLELSPTGDLQLRQTFWLPDGSVTEAVALEDLDGDGAPELVVVRGQGSEVGAVEGIVVAAYDLPGMTERWRSFQLGGYFFNSVRALRVVNTDSDPAPEVHVLLENPGSVRTLDGATGWFEWSLPGSFTAMDATSDRLPGANGGTVMVGDSSGTVTAFGYRSGFYREVFQHSVGARVDGISILGDEVWIGADGRLVLTRLRGRSLREVWRSTDYGPGLGRRTVPSPIPAAEVITVGRYGAFGFTPPTP